MQKTKNKRQNLIRTVWYAYAKRLLHIPHCCSTLSLKSYLAQCLIYNSNFAKFVAGEGFEPTTFSL